MAGCRWTDNTVFWLRARSAERRSQGLPAHSHYILSLLLPIKTHCSCATSQQPCSQPYTGTLLIRASSLTTNSDPSISLSCLFPTGHTQLLTWLL
ncbi:hypothetical protein XELAEV_18014057mg [Xenopus laevis]|uniref:Uncharacterized protein n=1 Tax=Xenopus laevis TaxID=8355 RepID=A0A974I016_XENLA|nr:hypothetical protein XELAEV_18014057mg [Xenopus laevis]